MNKLFSESVRSTYFKLILTPSQCNVLMMIRAQDEKIFYVPFVTQTINALASRGLVCLDRDGGLKGITKAGELLADLLEEAGFTVNKISGTSIFRVLSGGRSK